MDAAALTATEARTLLDRGELAARELVAACIAQIERIDPVVNAMVIRDFEQAQRTAAAADEAHAAGRSTGALHGLPVAIKDLQPTAGLRTTYGSPPFARHVPTEDAGIVARIRAAGGIVIGKTNIPERSIGANTVNPLFGATGNPFDPTLTCGGSSGGSAVALAANMAPLATGSDHGGSVRIPACFCGVVGHRATPGTVPFELRSMAQNFYSVQGPMARTVDDTALLLSVIADRSHGSFPHDPMMFPLDATAFASLERIDLGEMRIAVSADLGGVLVSEEIRRTFLDRIQRIAPLVAVCDEHPIDLRRAPDVDWRIRSDIFVTQYHAEAQTWDDSFNPNIRQSYDAALTMPMEEIAAARATQTELNRSVQAIFADYDVLLCPGVSVPPFPWTDRNPSHVDGVAVENYMAWLALTSAFSVVGHPVTALPCGLDGRGTPFGIQVVGPMYQDRRVLTLAAALERAFAEHEAMRRPIPDFNHLATQDAGCRNGRM
ncbi:MAG: amidase [Actinomycetota bacterium]